MEKRIFIANAPVDRVSSTEAIAVCKEFLHGNDCRHINTVNPEFVVEAQNNIPFRNILRQSDLALADGFGILLASRWLYGIKLERIPGVDFMIELCALAENECKSVFFLGGRGGVAQRTAEVLQKKFPALMVSGWSEYANVFPADSPAGGAIQTHQFSDGSRFVGRDDEKGINSPINTDILFVAFGTPKQELWIAENIKELSGVKIVMGVGGSFDLISGKIKRAPHMMRKFGFEWLWRFSLEPSRLRRMVNALVIFPVVCLMNGSVSKTR